MDTLINDVKHRARILHRAARAGDESALKRLGATSELRTLSAEEISANVQRRHALAVIAEGMGFSGWPHAKAVLSGDRVADYGELMHIDTGGSICNIWSAAYSEAKQIREEHGGYLLGYRRHFFVAEAPYIEALGLRPDDPDWGRIGRDWVRPSDRIPWQRLTQRAMDVRLRRSG
ncbi:MAG: hypothetical protein AAGF12_34155 [Myxococcota bacterium]